MRDSVDLVLEQWRTQRPDLDPGPMGVVGRLSRASRLVERLLKEPFANAGVEAWEFDVLATLRRSGPTASLTAGQLVASAMVSSGAITNRIDRLVARGLVSRDVDPGNRRQVLIALTDSGRELVDDLVVRHLDNERTILSVLSERDQTQLAALLRRFLLAHGDGAQKS